MGIFAKESHKRRELVASERDIKWETAADDDDNGCRRPAIAAVRGAEVAIVFHWEKCREPHKIVMESIV